MMLDLEHMDDESLECLREISSRQGWMTKKDLITLADGSDEPFGWGKISRHQTNVRTFIVLSSLIKDRFQQTKPLHLNVHDSPSAARLPLGDS